MTTILLFKLLTTPLLIAGLTWLVRHFGPTVGGLAMGVPLVTGPISVFTAIERGGAFASHTAVASLVGQVSTCVFCFAYARVAPRLGAWSSALCGAMAFSAATVLWNLFDWTLPAAAVLLLSALLLLTRLMPKGSEVRTQRSPPWWDLPLRMIVSAGFVFGLTSATGCLGPQISGLLTPFPVFVLILALFCHLHEGGTAASAMMRGVVLGSLSFAAFFVITAAAVTQLSLPVTYVLATGASMAASGVIYRLFHRPARLWP